MDVLLGFPFNAHGLLALIRDFDRALPIHLVGGFDWCSQMAGVVCLWYSPSLFEGSKWAFIVSYYLEFALVQGAEDLQNFVQFSDWSLNSKFFQLMLIPGKLQRIFKLLDFLLSLLLFIKLITLRLDNKRQLALLTSNTLHHIGICSMKSILQQLLGCFIIFWHSVHAFIKYPQTILNFTLQWLKADVTVINNMKGHPIDHSHTSLQWAYIRKWGRGLGGQFHTNHFILSTRASSWRLCLQECGKGLISTAL